jgi:hypothetical protein
MLLVDHREREVRERHPFLHERVGPHDEVDVARRDAVPDLRAVLPGHRGREQRVRHARRTFLLLEDGIEQRGLRAVGARPGRELQVRDRSRDAEERLDLAEMLPREHLGGRHDRGLVTGGDRDEGRVHRNERLARTDVALQQDVHRPRARHRRVDLVVRPALGGGRLERQRPVQPFEQRSLRLVRHADLGTFDAVLAERQPELEDEQLVELQPLDRRGELGL